MTKPLGQLTSKENQRIQKKETYWTPTEKDLLKKHMAQKY